MNASTEFLHYLQENSEYISCPICNSGDHELIFEGEALRSNSIKCVICMNCTHLFINPRPVLKAYKEFYDQVNYFELCAKYSGMSYEEKMRQFESPAFWTERFEHGYRLYDAYFNGKLSSRDTVFDFGCGDGAWLGGLQEKSGCSIDGEEISKKYVEIIKKKFGVDIFDSPLEEAGTGIIKKHKGNIKLAVVSGSLQHMIYPMECLRVAKEIIKDDGYLYICNWNILDHYMCSYKGETKRRLLGETLSLDHPHYFHKDSFLFMLEKAGFEVLHYNDNSTIRSRHMDALAVKKGNYDVTSIKPDPRKIISRIRSLESATIAQRLLSIEKSIGGDK